FSKGKHEIALEVSARTAFVEASEKHSFPNLAQFIARPAKNGGLGRIIDGKTGCSIEQTGANIGLGIDCLEAQPHVGKAAARIKIFTLPDAAHHAGPAAR